MIPTRQSMKKVVILRPGALGDVLAVRGVIRFVKDALPRAEIGLVAAGERGALLCREGWADRHYDWERAAFSWLFGDGTSPVPAALRAVFSGCDWILCYTDSEDGWAGLEARLNTLSPASAKVFCPSRPPAGHEQPIGKWLLQAPIAFCERYGLLEPEYRPDPGGLAAARLTFTEPPPFMPFSPGEYAVIHPGSGSRTKNWPLAQFVELGKLMMAIRDGQGRLAFAGIVITSGEADGELGERLCQALPGSFHVRQPELVVLADLLAYAKAYLGNDSGVSHLAASVAAADGGFPAETVLFGPSDSRIWAPPGALALSLGVGMDSLGPEKILERMRSFFGF
jgi:hypothetical protein